MTQWQQLLTSTLRGKPYSWIPLIDLYWLFLGYFILNASVILQDNPHIYDIKCHWKKYGSINPVPKCSSFHEECDREREIIPRPYWIPGQKLINSTVFFKTASYFLFIFCSNWPFFKINKICIVDWHTVHCSWCWQCSRRPHQSGVHKGGGQVTPRSIGGWQLPGSDRQNCPQEQSPVSPHSGRPGSYRRSDWKPPRHSQEGMYLKR